MASSPDLAIARHALDQHGHVTRAQLRAIGLGHSTVRRRVERGLLVQVGRSTFRLPSAPAKPLGAIAAACLDLGGTASHWTALAVAGLIPHRPVIDVTVRRQRSVWTGPVAPLVRIHTSTSLPRSDIARHRGIPTTSVARSLMGLGALVPAELSIEQLHELVDRAVETGLAGERWLWWTLAQRRCRGRDGVTAFEEALARRSDLGPTESWLEREVLRILDAAALPRPRLQRVVRRTGRFVGRVDFLYEDERIVLEALGHAPHRSRAALERDTRRANELQVLGLKVAQFSFDQVVNDPRSVATTVADLLAPSRTRRAA